MKKLFTLALVTLSTVVIYAQHDHAAQAAPVAKNTVNKAVQPQAAIPDAFGIKETEFDFGKIPQGKPVTHVFEVVNLGSDSLRIVNVQASCGCTTPEWERDKSFAKGAVTKITVGYNSAADGPFNKAVTITYNGTQTKVIFIKGEVWKTPATSAPENKSIDDLKN